MRYKLTKEEKARKEEMKKLFVQARKEVQIKQGKAINLVEIVFSEPFKFLTFREPAGLSLRKFPYYRKKDFILRINIDNDSYTVCDNLDYFEKIEELKFEYEDILGKELKKLK